jgi:transposase
MSRNLFWLSDEQWQRIEPHLPTDVRGKERVDDRRVISGIVHVLKSGCRWCDCPEAYGPSTTVYNRFVRWRGAGSGKISSGRWPAAADRQTCR